MSRSILFSTRHACRHATCNMCYCRTDEYRSGFVQCQAVPAGIGRRQDHTIARRLRRGTVHVVAKCSPFRHGNATQMHSAALPTDEQPESNYGWAERDQLKRRMCSRYRATVRNESVLTWMFSLHACLSTASVCTQTPSTQSTRIKAPSLTRTCESDRPMLLIAQCANKSVIK